jgi:hypothetical protein
MVEREQNGAVPARRQSDESAAAPVRDRAEVPVDIRGDLFGDRRLPVPSRAPVEVLRIAVAVARALRCDQNRPRAQAVECAREEADVHVGDWRRRQAVKEVDDRVALAAAAAIARRQVDCQP